MENKSGDLVEFFSEKEEETIGVIQFERNDGTLRIAVPGEWSGVMRMVTINRANIVRTLHNVWEN